MIKNVGCQFLGGVRNAQITHTNFVKFGYLIIMSPHLNNKKNANKFTVEYPSEIVGEFDKRVNFGFVARVLGGKCEDERTSRICLI